MKRGFEVLTQTNTFTSFTFRLHRLLQNVGLSSISPTQAIGDVNFTCLCHSGGLFTNVYKFSPICVYLFLVIEFVLYVI